MPTYLHSFSDGTRLSSFPYNSLPTYLSDELEKLPRRALRIIYPDLSYAAAFKKSNLVTLFKNTRIYKAFFSLTLFNIVIINFTHLLPLFQIFKTRAKVFSTGV